MITFWFEFASTYSWIAAERLRRRDEAPPDIRWRPFLLGPILKEMGLTTSPFVAWPTKGAYMWRDLERLAASLDLPFRRPERFPQNRLLAARLATAHRDAPWLPDFVGGVYRQQFVAGGDIAEPATLAVVLEELGVAADAAIARAEEQATKDALRAATEEAQALGLFGAPSFTVDGELFWGQDRLEDVLAWPTRTA